MTDQIKEALVLLGYFVEEPESVTVAHEADKQYNELLAYVYAIEDKLVDFCESSFMDVLMEIAVKRPKFLRSVSESRSQEPCEDDDEEKEFNNGPFGMGA